MSDDFVLCSVLAFDDETLAVQLLHRGTLKSCKETADFIDALSYSGPKKVVESCVRWMPFAGWGTTKKEMGVGDEQCLRF